MLCKDRIGVELCFVFSTSTQVSKVLGHSMTYRFPDNELWWHQQSHICICMGPAQGLAQSEPSMLLNGRTLKRHFKIKSFLLSSSVTFLAFPCRHFPPPHHCAKIPGTETCRTMVARMKFRAQEALPGFSRVRRNVSFPGNVFCSKWCYSLSSCLKVPFDKFLPNPRNTKWRAAMHQANVIWLLHKGVNSWGGSLTRVFHTRLCRPTVLSLKTDFPTSYFLHLSPPWAAHFPPSHPASPPQRFKLLSLKEVHQACATCKSHSPWTQGTLIPSHRFPHLI